MTSRQSRWRHDNRQVRVNIDATLVAIFRIVRGFYRTFATEAAYQQRTLTPPDTWSCPTLGLACVLMSRRISPELVLFADIWVSNNPQHFSFATTTDISKSRGWRQKIISKWGKTIGDIQLKDSSWSMVVVDTIQGTALYVIYFVCSYILLISRCKLWYRTFVPIYSC